VVAGADGLSKNKERSPRRAVEEVTADAKRVRARENRIVDETLMSFSFLKAKLFEIVGKSVRTKIEAKICNCDFSKLSFSLQL
jgi:hypothetical protein